MMVYGQQRLLSSGCVDVCVFVPTCVCSLVNGLWGQEQKTDKAHAVWPGVTDWTPCPWDHQASR